MSSKITCDSKGCRQPRMRGSVYCQPHASADQNQSVCPNCGQWQHAYTGDCFNDCAKRGFAPFSKAQS